MNGTLVYNESKVRKGVASVIGFSGMPSPEPVFARMTFGRLERRNIRTENLSFQMSINPNPDEPSEALSDEEACEYTKDIMKALGYGEQPYIIYKHFDIERVHYHVVSCRVNLQGKKIKDKFEKKRMEKLLLHLSEKYHYNVGNPKKKKTKKAEVLEEQPLLYNNITEIEPIPMGMEPVPSEPIQDYGIYDIGEITPIGTVPIKTETDSKEPRQNTPAIRFNPKARNVRKQYETIFAEAMTYNFNTLYQFVAICESMGMTAAVFDDKNGRHLSFQGLDENGEIVKAPVNEKDLGRNFYQQLEEKLELNSSKEQKAAMKSSSRPDRARVGRMAAFALKVSKSQRHFEKILEKKGIHVGFSFNMIDELFGITLVDAKTKHAFKASDLLPALNIQEVKNKAEQWITEEEIRTNRKKLQEQANRDDFLRTIDKSIKLEEERRLTKDAQVTWFDILRDTFRIGRKYDKRNIHKNIHKKY